MLHLYNPTGLQRLYSIPYHLVVSVEKELLESDSPNLVQICEDISIAYYRGSSDSKTIVEKYGTWEDYLRIKTHDSLTKSIINVLTDMIDKNFIPRYLTAVIMMEPIIISAYLKSQGNSIDS